MTEQVQHNIINNFDFSGLPEKGAHAGGVVCDGWEIKHKSSSADTKFSLTRSEKDGRSEILLDIQETKGWFRVMQKLDVSAFEKERFYFSLDHAMAQDEDSGAAIEFIAILGFDAKRHGTIHTKIVTSVESRTFMTPAEAVFSPASFDDDKDYYLVFQFNRPCKMILSNLTLAPVDRFGLRPNHRQQLNDSVKLAEERNGEIAPYRNFDFGIYKTLKELNDNMASRCRKDRIGWLTEMLFTALRLESFDTALGLVNYVLALPAGSLSREQREKLAPYILDTFQGVGDSDALYTWLCDNMDLIATNEKVFSAFSFLLYTKGVNVPEDRKLPSGKVNTYVLNKRIEEADDVLPLLYEVAAMADGNPEKQLLLATCHAGKDLNIYRNAVNRYLANFELPHITDIHFDKENIFQTIGFEELPKVTEGPKVSVILAGFSCADTIDYALRSVLNQTYQNIEILFCDDKSPDGSSEIVKRYADDPRLIIHSSKANQGPYNIRNELIAMSTGELITFHDSDDIAMPCRIEKQVESMLANNALISLGKWLRINTDGTFVVFKDHACLRMCVNSIMYYREVFEATGPYRSVLCGADSEFYEKARAIFGDEKVVHVPAPLVLGLWSDGSMTKAAGTEALDNGYRAPKRRAYAEVAGRQRVLGDAIITHEDVKTVTKKQGIYRKPAGVQKDTAKLKKAG